MNGDWLALGAVGVLALAGVRRGSRSDAVWLHGTKACPQMAQSGWVRPSDVVESAPDLAASVALRAVLIEEGTDNRFDPKRQRAAWAAREDEIQEHVEAADGRWHDASLIPMRGFAYASVDPYTASRYAGVSLRKQDAQGCVYEVELTPGVLVLPDEDWLGCFAAEIVEGEGACDHHNEVPRTDAGFKAWLYRLPALMGPALVAQLGKLTERAADEIQDPPFETVALRAALGRTVIRALLPTPAGRRWLEEGAREYATQIAHQGPLRIIGTVPTRSAYYVDEDGWVVSAAPQRDPTWRDGSAASRVRGAPVQIRRFTLQGTTYGGSPNVATDSGYHRTAVSKSGTSAPLKHLLANHASWVTGRVLDFGTGRGRDCKALGKRKNVTVSCYDPHHPQAAKRKLPAGTFDLVLANYVVNVLPPKQRRKAIKQMASKVKKGGVLVIAARGCGDRQGVQSARQWTPEGDGHAQYAATGELSRFQRFYAAGALQRELRAILGRTFSPLTVSSMSSSTALAAFRRS